MLYCHREFCDLTKCLLCRTEEKKRRKEMYFVHLCHHNIYWNDLMRNVSKPFHWYVRSDFKMLHKSKYKSIRISRICPKNESKTKAYDLYLILSDFIYYLFLVFMKGTCPQESVHTLGDNTTIHRTGGTSSNYYFHRSYWMFL